MPGFGKGSARLLVAAVTAAAGGKKPKEKWIQLFNGTDLSG